MPVKDLGAERRARLAAARLYLVCGARPTARRRRPRAADLLRAAIAGGVDIVQLREKHLGDEQLVRVADAARALCERLGALLIVNDRPSVATEAGADGVHVGQDDMPVAEVRELVGPDMLIGLSTHAPERSTRTTRRWPTTSAWARCTRPPPSPAARRWASSWSATRPPTPRCRSSRSAACDADNLGEAIDAGRAARCVLRAIADAEDPQSARRGSCASCSMAEPVRGAGLTQGRAGDEAPAGLEPLAEDERPPALLVAVAVCAVLALAVIVGAATVHDLSRRGGSLPGAMFLAGALALLAQGMYRRRYWAVLGFEALLAFQILVTSLALVVASTIAAAAVCLLSIGLGGWLFWKLVRVMGRIQAGER